MPEISFLVVVVVVLVLVLVVVVGEGGGREGLGDVAMTWAHALLVLAV